MSTGQVVILAGGLGTRLKPITEKIPKPMAPVRGKPFLFWQLEDVKRQGFTRILLLVSYLGEQIQDFFKNGEEFGLEIEYSFEPEPLGTGGALKNAEQKLDESFILLNGDSFLHAPHREMLLVRESKNLDALISTYDNKIPTPVIPNLKITDGLVTGYQKGAGAEKGFSGIDSGVYVLKRSLLKDRTPSKFQLEELWPELIRRQKLGVFPVRERFYDIGTPERLKEFEEKISDYF